MSKDKKNDPFDLFSNFDTNSSDSWGNVDNKDPFGNNKKEDPFAGFFPTEQPKPTEAPVKSNDPFASLPVEPKKEEKVVSIKGGSKESAKTDNKKTADKPKTEKEDKSAKVAGDYGKEVVDESWTIAYAGHQESPPHEMTLEEMRQKIELDFPELSKVRTKWFLEKDRKLAIPVVSGAKMG